MTTPNYSMSLTSLLNALTRQVAMNDSDLLISNITIDSRQVSEGCLFMAYPGTQCDGRDFILQAQTQGAVAVLYEKQADPSAVETIELFELPEQVTIPAIAVENLQHEVGFLAHQFFGEPSASMQVFGVTGTNGKTTSCYLLTQALTELELSTVMVGTIGMGALDNLNHTGHTTPDVISLHRQFAQWVEQGVTHVCMEVSSHALDQGRVNGVQFFCTLFTNLTHDHLDYHGTMQQYQTAKQRLFTDFRSELVITNADDVMGQGLVDVANSDFIASYGQAGDVMVDESALHETGMTLYIEGQGVDFEVTTSLIGQVNIPNILMLVTTLLSLSVSIEQIQKIIRQLRSAPGRMEPFFTENHPRVVIDYAHTPDALDKALQSVRAHCHGQLWCVFGCGGDRDQQKRKLMGEVADRWADHIVLTNDNPRSEQPEAITDAIALGIKQTVNVVHDRALAIQSVIQQAQATDWVLVAGKGHETTQQIGKQYIDFSDRQQVQTCLEVAA